MKDSTFTFLASTRIWFSPADSVPANIKEDLKKVRAFALSGNGKGAIELVFSGPISIYRGTPQSDEKLGRQFIPMHIVGMEEYGWLFKGVRHDHQEDGQSQPGQLRLHLPAR